MRKLFILLTDVYSEAKCTLVELNLIRVKQIRAWLMVYYTNSCVVNLFIPF